MGAPHAGALLIGFGLLGFCTGPARATEPAIDIINPESVAEVSSSAAHREMGDAAEPRPAEAATGAEAPETVSFIETAAPERPGVAASDAQDTTPAPPSNPNSFNFR